MQQRRQGSDAGGVWQAAKDALHPQGRQLLGAVGAAAEVNSPRQPRVQLGDGDVAFLPACHRHYLGLWMA